MFELIKKLPFYQQTWFQFILFVIRRFEADRCRDQAGSLTYTTLFAVVPMLTVFLVIISSIKALEPARQQLQQMIYSNFLPKTSIAFDKAFNVFTENSSNLTVIGVLFLFITTVLMLTSIESVFNRIWRVKETRNGIIGFMRYWTIISLGPILLGSAFVISSTLASMNVLSNNFAGYEVDGTALFAVISFALTTLGFFILYWTIPNRSVPIKAAAIAGVFGAVAFELLKNLFGFVMTNFTSYTLVYGAFAAVPIFLLWIFLSWNIVLLGVEISYALTAFHTGKIQTRHPVLMMLDILELFYKKQKTGQVVTDTEALDILGRGEIGRWPLYVQLLEKQNLVKRTDNNEYVLVRNLDEIDFWSFYTSLPYTLPRRKDVEHVHDDDVWMKHIGPTLIESDEYLAAKLSIPLSTILDDK
ncbi:YihY family inner membrane protein [Acinetobacter bereziniae]|jgi:membrane protein|uniref:YihY family inner membrane protein n=1 Tax=Acinetobacter bereziniae TaxID=106648 RepID=UPI00124EC792|nr:YihY family inner membrane protein [Acinetobacter bereziniae]MBJ8552830.1 YihY family inner membrane protein [Acinetobacter bereziniae]MCU4317283.1 YihY family inner membrane protein [Acinetobacter bereziniae]MCU4437342.1 YihY family inner membrane protein [Acinetobacter bereziniae]MCV2444167.1 YihY family inner membrane protein [Acinetobacter bereziniae]MDR6541993.1 membrane protein [Acinetobacter bereziniae]